jgi:2-alkyl-3-oxoalkanoate reductase
LRILVTGATGFLGGAACKQLQAQGHELIASGRDLAKGARLVLEARGTARFDRAQHVRFEPADLCDASATRRLCQDVDAVVHCAALSSPWGSRDAFQRANVEATRTLLAACQAAGVKRFVHVSTPSIYMDGRDRELVREDDPLPPPINHYAATKLAAEALVQRAHEGGLSSVILRPRAIFGPGDTTIFPRVLRALETGRLPRIGSGQNRVDLTYVDNVVAAIGCALSAGKQATGRAFNITNGEPVLLWEVLGRLCRELALPPPRGRVSRRLALTLAGALEIYHRALKAGQEPKLTRFAVQVLSCTMTLDIGRARTLLGYAPAVTVDTGLTRFVKWWKEEGCRA